MEKISFCINTAKNELEYIKLLLKSMDKNLRYDNHEIIIFVDSDNQGTFEWLKNNKNKFNRFKFNIINNNTGNPVGYQANSNYMFSLANNEIVALIQSDMVIGKDFDFHIIENMEENKVLSGARIEPPLHTSSPDKYTENFGLTPEEFKFDEFNEFCEKNKKDDISEFFGLPWITYKKNWDKVGGFDTAFRWGKEDLDISNRFKLAGINAKTVWSALIYHFTCVSSRGETWYDNTNESNLIVECQSRADKYETRKFIRRWRYHPGFDRPTFRYKTTANIHTDILSDWMTLLKIEPFFDKIYIDNPILVDHVLHHQKDEHMHVNWRLGFGNYGKDFWKNHYQYINIDNIKDKFIISDGIEIENDDVLIDFKLNDITNENALFFGQLNNFINDTDCGYYHSDVFQIHLTNKVNNIDDYIKVSNPSINKLEFENG
tara:strand:+ start:74 stop:1369 length:1296 start_codon:yes stop_codon:yes gene_type:complete